MSQPKEARLLSRDSRSAILLAAKAAFLEHGFLHVSLRSIAHDAGLTTGAIYGNFRCKEDLFDAVVSDAGEGLVELYKQIVEKYAELPCEGRSRDVVGDFERESLARLVDFIYDNYDCFRLICTCSSGTSWERYIDRLMELELLSAIEYRRRHRTQDASYGNQNPVLLRYLVNQFVHGIFQPVALGLGRQDAQDFVYGYGCFLHKGIREMIS